MAAEKEKKTAQKGTKEQIHLQQQQQKVYQQQQQLQHQQQQTQQQPEGTEKNWNSEVREESHGQEEYCNGDDSDKEETTMAANSGKKQKLNPLMNFRFDMEEIVKHIPFPD